MTGIYKITNPFNQVYIGQSIDIDNRIQSHKCGISSNRHLSMSITKHGVENHRFEVLEECDKNYLINRERHYLRLYKKDHLLFNYSIYLLSIENKDFEFINDCDFGINFLTKTRQEKEIKKLKWLNKEVYLKIKIAKNIKKDLGEEECKKIAAEALEKKYKSLKKK